MIHALHSCASPEHYTPQAYTQAAHGVLGGIDLDPASNAIANRTVRATTFYGSGIYRGPCGTPIKAEPSGLERPWFGRIWCNPPGDSQGRLIKAFWIQACRHVLFNGGVVLWAGYSLGPMQRLHGCEPFDDGTQCPGPRDWPTVYVGGGAPQTTTSGRIMWTSGTTGQPGRQPGHNNYFSLLGGTQAQRGRFRSIFGAYGDYHAPRHWPSRRRDLVSEIRAALRDDGPQSKLGLSRRIGARRADVITTINRMLAMGTVESCDAGYRCSHIQGTPA